MCCLGVYNVELRSEFLIARDGSQGALITSNPSLICCVALVFHSLAHLSRYSTSNVVCACNVVAPVVRDVFASVCHSVEKVNWHSVSLALMNFVGFTTYDYFF
jgi:hypothetical protein